MSRAKRQELVWKVVDETLTADEAFKISTILPVHSAEVAPEEGMEVRETGPIYARISADRQMIRVAGPDGFVDYRYTKAIPLSAEEKEKRHCVKIYMAEKGATKATP